LDLATPLAILPRIADLIIKHAFPGGLKTGLWSLPHLAGAS